MTSRSDITYYYNRSIADMTSWDEIIQEQSSQIGRLANGTEQMDLACFYFANYCKARMRAQANAIAWASR